LVATADSVLVSYDYRADRPIAVPADWRASIEAFEIPGPMASGASPRSSEAESP